MESLIERAKGGEPLAFEKLVTFPEMETFINQLLKAMQKRNRNKDKEDIKNIIYNEIWYRLQKYPVEKHGNSIQSFKYYFCKFGVKRIKQKLQIEMKKNNRIGEEMETMNNIELLNGEHKNKFYTTSDEYSFILEDTIKRALTKREYKLYQLHYEYGYNLNECATILSLSVSQIKRIWKNVKRKINEEIGGH